MSNSYLLYHGVFYDSEKQIFTLADTQNIIFTEKLRVERTQILFWDEQFQLILLNLKIWNIEVPVYLQNEGKELRRQIERTLSKNKLFLSAQIEISFVNDSGQLKYLIEVTKLEKEAYQLNKSGFTLELFNKTSKAVSAISSLRHGSIPYWGIMAAHNNYFQSTELIICNSFGGIVEAVEKNIYLLKGNEIVTPAHSSGAYIDVSRSTVFESVKQSGLVIHEKEKISSMDILEADEVFLCNSICGIEWVKAFQNKRFFCKKIRLINVKFNELLIK